MFVSYSQGKKEEDNKIMFVKFCLFDLSDIQQVSAVLVVPLAV